MYRGIIPARAGFTKGHIVEANEETGSSPLARGLHRPTHRRRAIHGIIPARAGFTPAISTGTLNWPDHPRSRGVYGAMPATNKTENGSSPLARGLRLSVHTALRLLGIIPARAGFTLDRGAIRCAVRDHPRSRGVYGSGGAAPLPRAGIIPARAGFTDRNRRRPRSRRDHPRSRGVYGRW